MIYGIELTTLTGKQPINFVLHNKESCGDGIRNEEKRRRRKVGDVIKRIAILKWTCMDMSLGKTIHDRKKIYCSVNLDRPKEVLEDTQKDG